MLLRHYWLTLAVALVGAGLIWDAEALLGLGVFLFLAGFVARAWARLSLDNVEIERQLPESRAFPGGTLKLGYRVTNRKLLPLPTLEVRDQLPEALAPPGLELRPAGAPGMQWYTRDTHLGPFQRTSWSLELSCARRGHYKIGPARLRSGDGFGLFSNERDEPVVNTVVVYPETRSMTDLGLPAARPLGDRRGRDRIVEDPLRIAGVRDYRSGDPLHRIDWKATARRGELQSRVYEPSATQHLLVALNVDTMEHPWQGFVPELLEESIVVAASVARWAFEHSYAVGLLANGSIPDSDRPVAMAPGRRPDQLARLLEVLGGIGPMTLTALSAVLERESHQLPFGATLAVVTGLMPEPLAAVLRRLHASGQQVVVLSLGDDTWGELLGEVPVRPVSLNAVEEAAP